MATVLSKGGFAVALFATLAFLASGCGQPAGTAKDTHTDKPAPKADGHAAAGKGDGDKNAPAKAEAKEDHAGWWCDEHALPEAVCDQCSKKYREAEKAKGNWCEHKRVKTSCFKCNPGLKDKYAAEYRAKLGKEPPAAEDDGKKN